MAVGKLVNQASSSGCLCLVLHGPPCSAVLRMVRNGCLFFCPVLVSLAGCPRAKFQAGAFFGIAQMDAAVHQRGMEEASSSSREVSMDSPLLLEQVDFSSLAELR